MIQLLVQTWTGRRRSFPRPLRSRLAALALSAVFAITVQLFDTQCLRAKLNDQPNIVFILADDLGYGDLGCYGHPEARTPHIDQLAADGVRFTQHYANGPECSPTRTAFLTGRYQQRVGGLECAIGTGNVGRYDDAIRLARQRELGLPADQTVIPGRLIEAGYECGVFGKWHLGYEPHFNPIEHGWSEFFGYLGGNVHYFSHRETSPLHVLFEGRLPVYRDGYMTKLITDSSIAFIEQSERPFFLFVSHECPHFPYQGPADARKVVTAENWMEIDSKTYVTMLEDLDSEVGRLLAAIERKGIREDTIIVFVSDNGGFAGAAHMGPLSGAKSSTLEGGIRVPLVIRWPGHIKPQATCDQVSVTFDLTKSFLRLAGAEVDEQKLDGYDIIEHVIEDKRDFSRTLFWRGKRGERVWSAVRDGDMKLVEKVQAGETNRWLFDLSRDVGELDDRAASRPGQADRLERKLRRWEEEMRPTR